MEIIQGNQANQQRLKIEVVLVDGKNIEINSPFDSIVCAKLLTEAIRIVLSKIQVTVVQKPATEEKPMPETKLEVIP